MSIMDKLKQRDYKGCGLIFCDWHSQRLWPSPSSWMVETNCHYFPMISLTPNVGCKYVCEDILKLQGNNYIKVLYFQFLFHFWKWWEDSVLMYSNIQEAWWKVNHGYLDMRKEMNPPKQQVKCTYSQTC
jgi:hypothetical protein